MSSLRETARLLDETDDNIVACAAAYEELIASEEATVDDRVDAAMVYWAASDFGLAAAKRLPEGFEWHALDRWQAILTEAVRRDPTHCEARFWEMYCMRIWFSKYPPEEIRAFLDDPGRRCEGAFATMWRISGGDASDIAAGQSVLAEPHLRQSSKGRYIASHVDASVRSIEARVVVPQPD